MVVPYGPALLYCWSLGGRSVRGRTVLRFYVLKCAGRWCILVTV